MRRAIESSESLEARPPAVSRPPRLHGLLLLTVMTVVGCSNAAPPSTAAPSAIQSAVLEIRTVQVADPGNAAVAIVPFRPGIYGACTSAPQDSNGCLSVGAVSYPYSIGELEVSVDQYVTFLNTVDPDGTNAHGLYLANMDPVAWPKYGPITRSTASTVAPGRHYAIAYPEWTDKPIGFTDFLDAARFVNALTNGTVLSRTAASSGGFTVTTTSLRLSPQTETGMYDLAGTTRTGATRTRTTGFVIPTQDEWIKAAYFDPAGGGVDSYWEYPTGPTDPPTATKLDPSTGDVVVSTTPPVSTYNPDGRDAKAGTYPTWCPSQVSQIACENTNPLGLSAEQYRSDYHANVSTVGQTGSRSPWGTLDQGGNVVEWTDTIAPSPTGSTDGRVWRYLHGGVSNAPAYQLWISAVGHAPESDPVFEYSYPWQGFRVGVIGDLGANQPLT